MKMKFIIFAVILVVCTAIFFGCANSPKEKTVIKLSAKEAKEMIDNGNVTVVDVREINEFENGHIDKAILLPLGQIENDSASKLPNKEAIILVYCRSGVRSAEGSEQLFLLGYSNVYDMGGIISWKEEGYPTV